MMYDTFNGIVGVDIETSSVLPISVGAWAYSQHPSTIALCVVFCWSSGKHCAKQFVIWEPGDALPREIVAFIKAGGKLLAHNQSFELAIFEHVLKQIKQAGELGQFRTPRHIIRAIVEMIDPKIGETVYDPAAGTAGFLVAVYNHMRLANSSPRCTSPLSTPVRLTATRWPRRSLSA